MQQVFSERGLNEKQYLEKTYIDKETKLVVKRYPNYISQCVPIEEKEKDFANDQKVNNYEALNSKDSEKKTQDFSQIKDEDFGREIVDIPILNGKLFLSCNLCQDDFIEAEIKRREQKQDVKNKVKNKIKVIGITDCCFRSVCADCLKLKVFYSVTK